MKGTEVVTYLDICLGIHFFYQFPLMRIHMKKPNIFRKEKEGKIQKKKKLYGGTQTPKAGWWIIHK